MKKLGLLLTVAAGVSCTSKALPPAHDYGESHVVGTGHGAAPPGEPAGYAAEAVDASDAGSTAGPGAEDLARLNMTGALPHHGANCPSSLPGAITRITMTPRGVDVAVTSSDSRIEHRIVELAVYQASGLTRLRSRPHDQLHGGPAWIGHCPIIVNDQTRVTATLIPHGAMLHVEARSPSLATALQDVIKARAARLPGYASS